MTYWYPTARLYRQDRPGDWLEVMERVVWDAARLAAKKTGEVPLVHPEGCNLRSAQSKPTPGATMVPVSFGELIDKIVILQIKSQRAPSLAMASNAQYELKVLKDTLARVEVSTPRASRLRTELEIINETLWELEDKIRASERSGASDAVIADLAREIIAANDRRAVMKKQLDQCVGCAVISEKVYNGAVMGETS